MNSSKKRKKYTRIIQSILWTVGIFSVLFILCMSPFLFDPYISLAQPSFAGLPPAQVATANGTILEIVNIWFDTNPSMLGFINSQRSGCVPSSYRLLINRLPQICKNLNAIIEPRYFGFDGKNYSLSEILQKGVYSPTETNVNHDLISLLKHVDPTEPTIIFTDFEEEGKEIQISAFGEAMKRIFVDNRCLSVVAMKSAYSGILYNYLGNDIDYAYGIPGNGKAENTVKTYNHHHRPRSFYALIIGTEEECLALKDAVCSAYTEINQSEVTGIAQKVITRDQWAHDAQKLKEFEDLESIDYFLNGEADIVYPINSDHITIDHDLNAEEGIDAPWKAIYGVPEYKLSKQTEDLFSQFQIGIIPKSSLYQQTYATDEFDKPVPQIFKVTKYFMDELSLAESASVLLGRGSHRIELKADPFEDEKEWFQTSQVQALKSGLSFSLNVNISDCESGLYRVVIPVTGIHPKDKDTKDGSNWIQQWSNSSLTQSLRNDETIPRRTMFLSEQLESIRKVEAQQANTENYEIAYITIDLRID